MPMVDPETGNPSAFFMRWWQDQVRSNAAIANLDTPAAVSAVLDVLAPSASRGDVLYRGATLWSRLAAGTSGFALLTQGPGADPVWGEVTGSAASQAEVTDATYTTADSDFAGNKTLLVSNASGCTVTIAPDLTEKEDLDFIQTGAGTISFTAGAGVTLLKPSSFAAGTRAQYSWAKITPSVAVADLYYLRGDLGAAPTGLTELFASDGDALFASDGDGFIVP